MIDKVGKECLTKSLASLTGCNVQVLEPHTWTGSKRGVVSEAQGVAYDLVINLEDKYRTEVIVQNVLFEIGYGSSYGVRKTLVFCQFINEPPYLRDVRGFAGSNQRFAFFLKNLLSTE